MTKLEELEAENTLMNKQLEQIEELGNENLNALLDRIKAHRSAPDVYDPPTFDQMADRILELEAENTLMNKQLEQIEELGNENLNALLDRIKAHRSAPDVYDPPTFDQMADRILELEDRIATLHGSAEAFYNGIAMEYYGKPIDRIRIIQK